MDTQQIEINLSAIISRIKSVASPRRVILFGSAARGTAGPQSDLDLLVIVADGVHRRKTMQDIYRSLFDLGIATDVIVVTEGDVAQYSEDLGMVIKPALAEGKVVYDAAA